MDCVQLDNIKKIIEYLNHISTETNKILTSDNIQSNEQLYKTIYQINQQAHSIRKMLNTK